MNYKSLTGFFISGEKHKNEMGQKKQNRETERKKLSKQISTKNLKLFYVRPIVIWFSISFFIRKDL